MGVAVAAPPATSDAEHRLAGVRAWWRVRNPPPSLAQRLDLLYTGTIIAAIFGALAYGTASSALAQVVTPHWLAVTGPALALLALLFTTHWGAYQGPVVFSVADVAYLLGAPLPRRGLAARRLMLALTGGAAAGAIAACVVIVGLAGQGRGIALDDAAGLTVGLAELGLFAVAGAWAVEGSARWERAARRATWPGILAAAALAAASDAGEIGREIALWSGPWGWAVQPAAGAGDVQSLAALLILTLVTAVAAAAAVRGCGDCPTERHLRRAEARASAVVALASYDARRARRALETVGARGGRHDTRLRRPRTPRLAIPWRDAVSALRTPGRVVEGAVLAGAGTILGLLEADRPVAVTVAALLAYLGASRMVWPLRSELDVPARARVMLVPRLGRVLLGHAVVPVVVTTSAATLGVAGCAVAGALPAHGAAAALLAVAVAPLLCCCAGMSARREGRMPPSVLVTAVAADPSGGASFLSAWLAFWPAMAATLGAVPIILVANGAAAAAAGWTVIATGVLVYLLQQDVVKD
jgi:hypothetical protein